MFSKGKSFSVFPVKALYDFHQPNNNIPLQAGVTVSSRNFKKAVDRNRIKRVLREAWRLQKKPLTDQLTSCKKQLAVFLIYTGKDLPVYTDIYKKIGILIARLSEMEELQSTTTQL